MSTSRRLTRAQCANCTCSPGLLSRTNKRRTWFAKQIDIHRRGGSLSPRSGSRKGSVMTIDASTLCLPEVQEVNTSDRLEALRKQMAERDLAVYIIPSEDEHHSEYVSAKDQRRSFISGFLGSAGIAVITRDLSSLNDTPQGTAALSTDGRYFDQAANELDFNWLLLKQGSKDQANWYDWTVNEAAQIYADSGKTVNIGVDPKLISYRLFEKLSSLVEEKKTSVNAKINLLPVKENLVDKIWKDFEEVPSVASNPITFLDGKFAGTLPLEKINTINVAVKRKSAYGMIVSALDEIAWLLNLRGSDIEFNPVFYSYLIITNDAIIFFADESKFEAGIADYLKSFHVEILPYSEFWSYLKDLSENFRSENRKVLLPESTSWEVVRALNCQYETISVSPLADQKALKNSTELKGAKSAHLKDGRALVKFLAWLEEQIVIKQELIDEVGASEQLTKFREEEENFIGLSFETISATGANGSIIHYRPLKSSRNVINPEKLYLNDSGSQFLEGTTDITRTIHLGKPSKEEIRNYTLVLKGNISLSSLKFPEGTTGSQLDPIARQYLWTEGLDYQHGTSHGIGAYLNVHEGPIGISPRKGNDSRVLEPGHLLSNEPGYYEEGEYGIRIENVMFVKDSGLTFNGKKHYMFETVTRVPFCKKLIDVSLLSREEKNWIDLYHEVIWDELHTSFAKNSFTYNWLQKETSPL